MIIDHVDYHKITNVKKTSSRRMVKNELDSFRTAAINNLIKLFIKLINNLLEKERTAFFCYKIATSNFRRVINHNVER